MKKLRIVIVEVSQAQKLRTLCFVWVLSLAGLCAAQDRILWRDPGQIERVSFKNPANGADTPREPFYFVGEDLGGTSPKVLVRDSAGVLWRVKSGYEIRSESFSTRIVAALGYFAEPTVFVPGGRIVGVKGLKRASNFIHQDGSFAAAAFERRDPGLKYLADRDWAWNDNPFSQTRELKALKILMILLSNWDSKDVRDRKLGSNTGILERRLHDRVEWIYFVNDWGQTLGSWGAELKPKSWNCAAFTQQSGSFIRGQAGQYVRFNFVGHHTPEFSSDITVADVRWLMRYLGRITDVQIRSGLRASGASNEEVECFAAALRSRINQLKRIAGAPGSKAGVTPLRPVHIVAGPGPN